MEPNPYLLARALYEVNGQREAALQQLNQALEEKLGKQAFHSLDKTVFNPSGRDRFPRFHLAVAHHLYHPRPMGSTDYLNCTYAEVFTELWDWYPQQVWLIELFIKDFRKPSLDQLYINPAPEEEYGDAESPGEIGNLLKKNRLAGLLALSSDHFLPYGIPILDLEQVNLTTEQSWRGLKTYLQKNVQPIPYPSALPGPCTIWENMVWVFPEKVVEKGLDLLFGDFNREKAVLEKRWASMLNQAPFITAFQQALDKCLVKYPELQEAWTLYTGIERLEPLEFGLELKKALVRETDFSDFVVRCFH